jgi:mRNA interferase HigB
MNVISRRAIDTAIAQRPDAERWLNTWWKLANRVQWHSLEEVRRNYPSADQVGGCLVFDVRGNRYRLIAGVTYANPWAGGTLYIKHFLTHAEYNRGDWKRDCE